MPDPVALDPPAHPRHRRGVLRRALRMDVARLRRSHHLLAIILLATAVGVAFAALWARGELAGADARAYWAAVRIALNGGDPYHPASPFMPYVYAPWLLPVFIPWALLPWDVAWFVWRGASMILLGWSIAWAYRRRPVATAALTWVLALPFIANLDTGNVNLVLVFMLWAAEFSGPRVAGLLWALATAVKWVPVVFLPLLAPRGRAWGIIFLAVAGVLTLLTLDATIVQLQVLLAFPRPARVDYLVLLWALVPRLWRDPDPARYLRPSTWWAAARGGLADIRTPGATAARLRRAFGLPTA